MKIELVSNTRTGLSVSKPLGNNVSCVTRGRFWRIPLVWLTLSIMACFLANRAKCEIIVDDFDDPVSIDLPFLLSSQVVMQENIGPLSAERWTEVVDLNVDAAGLVSVHDSVLDFRIDGTDPNPIARPFDRIATLNMRYFLDSPIDATEQGANNALAVDFVSLNSFSGSLARIDAFLEDTDRPGASFVSQFFELPTPPGKFTLYFPFDSFGLRGGSGREMFDSVDELFLSISPINRSGGEESFQFQAQIDRIRFTSVPEPTTVIASTFGVLVHYIFLVWRRRKWRVEQSVFSVQ